MGLLRVGLSAASSVLADQWREYFYCDSLAEDVLVKKGEKKKSKGGFNTKGNDNIISNGSIIAVNEGQCMIIIDQGAMVEMTAEPGEFVYDSSTESSIFYGDLGENVAKTFKTFMRRVSAGGETARDQRVYFFNTKEILNNRYGTANPIPLRIIDENIGLDYTAHVKSHGLFTYKMIDPVLFYKNICGNVVDEFRRDKIDSQMRSELITELQPALAEVVGKGIRYDAIINHTDELRDALRTGLSENWIGRYGIDLVSISIAPFNLTDKDQKVINDLQAMAVYGDARMARARLVGAQAAAMEAAASNESTGPLMAFAGMNMAAQAGGMNAQSLFAMDNQNQQNQQVQNQQMQNQQSQKIVAGWACVCGASGNTGKFCNECGKPKPGENFWSCGCGKQNKGKFCSECGKKKPDGLPQYQCDKCGWEPEDPTKPPKFCPECGDPFDDGDIKK